MLRGGECDGLSFERKSASCLVPPVTDFSTRSDRLWSQVHRCETGPTSTRSFFFFGAQNQFSLDGWRAHGRRYSDHLEYNIHADHF